MITAEAWVTGEEQQSETPDPGKPLLLATIRAARDGDQRAFEDLMHTTERRVAHLAWRILGDAEEVKEATQETFLRVFRHLGRYDEARDFHGWLFRIALNVCRDLDRRRRRRRLFVPLDEPAMVATSEHPDDAITRDREMALLGRAIDSLPEKERLAIILREVEELSTESVAEIIGNSPATVRVQVRNARAKIRRWVDAWRGKATS
jgi:RNA polymerase sigma-70 factor (ECF subfamily)